MVDEFLRSACRRQCCGGELSVTEVGERLSAHKRRIYGVPQRHLSRVECRVFDVHAGIAPRTSFVSEYHKACRRNFGLRSLCAFGHLPNIFESLFRNFCLVVYRLVNVSCALGFVALLGEFPDELKVVHHATFLLRLSGFEEEVQIHRAEIIRQKFV